MKSSATILNSLRKPAAETKRKVPHPFLICADPNFIGFSDEEEEEVEEEDNGRGRGGLPQSPSHDLSLLIFHCLHLF